MMNTPQETSIDEMIELYRAVYRALHTATAQDWLELDLSMGQLKVLFTLANMGAATIGQIAEQLGVSLPTASQLVDRLVRAGLAERTIDGADRRYTWVRLAAAGHELVLRLRQGSGSQLRAWLDQLQPDEFAALVCGMQALAQIVRQQSHEDVTTAQDATIA